MLRNFRFRNKVRRQLVVELNQGGITQEQYEKALRVVNDSSRTQDIINRTVTLTGGPHPVLESIIKFVVDNWPAILKAIIMIATMI